MRFTLTRFGGFAGIGKQVAALDTAQAPEAHQVRLQELLAQSNFWSLPAELPGKAPVPDSFSYELTVEDAGKQHAVAFDQASQTPELAALVGAIKAAATG